MSVLSLMFSEAFDIAVRDLAAAERHGWAVAGPEAYPLVLRINPGHGGAAAIGMGTKSSSRAVSGQSPSSWPRKTAAAAKTVVAAASGELTVRLSWVRRR